MATIFPEGLTGRSCQQGRPSGKIYLSTPWIPNEPSFALSAGYGDIVVALLALGVVYLLARRHPNARLLTIGWIALGLFDFVAALISGMFYIRPFAAQLAADGVSLTYLTYVLIVPV